MESNEEKTFPPTDNTQSDKDSFAPGSSLGETQAPPPSAPEDMSTQPKVEQTQKKGRKGWGFVVAVIAIIFSIFIGFASIISLLLYLIGTSVVNLSSIQSPTHYAASKYKEELISGSMLSSEKVLILDIRGVITGGYDRFSEVANSDVICDMLEQAKKDGQVKAIVLRLDTPGGEVVASDMIRHKVLELKEEGITVVSSMGSVAASGGYWIAAESDYIIANRLTITGSIGVIMQGYNYRGLLDKIGVYTETYKSGPMKDLGNPSRIRTEAEKKVIQDLINETYGEFLKIVAEGRKEKGITEEKLRTTELGDGRIFSGKQALELGLVDELGYLEDAVKKAGDLAGTTNYKVIYYTKKFNFFDIFNSEAKSASAGIKIDTPWGENLNSLLEPGKLYLLPTY